jgi:phage anti-repressor protein
MFAKDLHQILSFAKDLHQILSFAKDFSKIFKLKRFQQKCYGEPSL